VTESLLRSKAHDVSEPAFNLDEVLERVGGDDELLAELANRFRDTLPKKLDELQRLAALRDLAALRLVAHGMRGACANFSAAPAVRAAHALESVGDEATHEEIGACLSTLGVELRRLADALPVS
jgi:two-component system, sensor histidine kinase and response regulator